MGYETLRPKVTKKLLQNDIQPTEFLVAFTSGATSGAVFFYFFMLLKSNNFFFLKKIDCSCTYYTI